MASDRFQQRAELYKLDRFQQRADLQSQQQKPTQTSDYLRHGLRSGARLAEGLASGITSLPRLAATGIDVVSGTKTRDYVPDLGEKLKKYISEPVLGKLQEPQGTIETGADEFINTFGQFFAPTGVIGAAGKALGLASKAGKVLTTGEKIAKTGKRIAQTAALAGAEKTADWGTRALDIPEKYAMPIRMGTVLGASYLTHRGALPKLKESYYGEAKDLLADKTIKGTELTGFTKNLRSLVDKHSDKISDKSFLTAHKLSTGSKVPINDVIELHKELNQLRYGKASVGLTGEATREVGNTAGELSKDLEGIFNKKATSKTVKQGLDKYLTAEQLHQAERMSETVGENVGKAINSKSGQKVADKFVNGKTLFGLFGIPKIYVPYKIIKGMGEGVYGSAKGVVDFSQKLAKYPRIRKAYYNVLEEAAGDGGIGAILSNLNRLDKLL
jgi:hypothetical protein